MDSIDIEVEGLANLEHTLLELSEELGARKAAGIFTSATRIGAKEYHKELIKTAPVSNQTRTVKTKSGQKVTITPGFLKSRIKIKASNNTRGVINKKFSAGDFSVVKVGAFKVPYIVQVEYGTSRTRPNPFIRAAFSSQTPFVIKIIEKSLNKKIELAIKRLSNR